MNLAMVDLNLLVAFEALFQERNVTRAGRRVGLAQPSMSNALVRLRTLFNDELFVRTAQGMQPTTRAVSLAPAVTTALATIRKAIAQERHFSPRTASGRFVIGTTDYGDLLVVPRVVARLAAEAPNMNLFVRPTLDRVEMVRRLEKGEIDVLIGGHLPPTPRTIHQRLFIERFVCLRDKRRAASARISRSQFLALPHVWFTSAGSDEGPSDIDGFLESKGMKRRIVVRLPHVVAVPFAVAGTSMIATITERIAKRFARLAGVEICPLPFPTPTFAIDVVYAADRHDDAPLQWLIKVIGEVADA